MSTFSGKSQPLSESLAMIWARIFLASLVIGVIADLVESSIPVCTVMGGILGAFVCFVAYSCQQMAGHLSESRTLLRKLGEEQRDSRLFWSKGQPQRLSGSPVYVARGVTGTRISLHPLGLVLFGAMVAVSVYLFPEDWARISRPDAWSFQSQAVAVAFFLLALALVLQRRTCYSVYPKALLYSSPWSTYWAALDEVQWIYPTIQSQDLQVQVLSATSVRREIFMQCRRGSARVPWDARLWQALVAHSPSARVGYSEELAQQWAELSESDLVSFASSSREMPRATIL